MVIMALHLHRFELLIFHFSRPTRRFGAYSNYKPTPSWAKTVFVVSRVHDLDDGRMPFVQMED